MAEPTGRSFDKSKAKAAQVALSHKKGLTLRRFGKTGIPLAMGAGPRTEDGYKKLTGRANALTRGRGLKLGLKKPPSTPTATTPKPAAPAPQATVTREFKQKLPMGKVTPPNRRGLKVPRFK